MKLHVYGQDRKLIEKIAKRAMKIADWSATRSILDVQMDLAATHLNGCPLKRRELLKAKDFDFIHDLGGIARHLNRNTGKLLGCFTPRFAKPEGE